MVNDFILNFTARLFLRVGEIVDFRWISTLVLARVLRYTRIATYSKQGVVAVAGGLL